MLIDLHLKISDSDANIYVDVVFLHVRVHGRNGIRIGEMLEEKPCDKGAEPLLLVEGHPAEPSAVTAMKAASIILHISTLFHVGLV